MSVGRSRDRSEFSAGNASSSVFSWGEGTYGQLGRGEELLVASAPARIKDFLPPGTHVKAISCGHRHSVFLDSQGTVYACGKSSFGVLGLTHTPNVFLPTPVPEFKDAVQISAGAYHTTIVTEYGDVYTTGCSVDTPERKLESQNDQVICDVSPRRVNGLSHPITMVAAGNCHTLALDKAGKVWSWGNGLCGRLGHGNTTTYQNPQVVKALATLTVTTVAAGGYHSAAVVITADAGSASGVQHALYTWGQGRFGALGHGHERDVSLPQKIKSIVRRHVVSVSCGEHHMAASLNGRLHTWGRGDMGRLGHPDSHDVSTPRHVDRLGEQYVEEVKCGVQATVARSADGRLYYIGGVRRSADNTTNVSTFLKDRSCVAVASGGWQNLAIAGPSRKLSASSPGGTESRQTAKENENMANIRADIVFSPGREGSPSDVEPRKHTPVATVHPRRSMDRSEGDMDRKGNDATNVAYPPPKSPSVRMSEKKVRIAEGSPQQRSPTPMQSPPLVSQSGKRLMKSPGTGRISKQELEEINRDLSEKLIQAEQENIDILQRWTKAQQEYENEVSRGSTVATKSPMRSSPVVKRGWSPTSSGQLQRDRLAQAIETMNGILMREQGPQYDGDAINAAADVVRAHDVLVDKFEKDLVSALAERDELREETATLKNECEALIEKNRRMSVMIETVPMMREELESLKNMLSSQENLNVGLKQENSILKSEIKDMKASARKARSPSPKKEKPDDNVEFLRRVTQTQREALDTAEEKAREWEDLANTMKRDLQIEKDTVSELRTQHAEEMERLANKFRVLSPTKSPQYPDLRKDLNRLREELEAARSVPDLRPEVNRLRQELEAARSVPDLRPEVNRLRQELEAARSVPDLRPEVNRLRQELEAARSVPRTQSPKPPPYPDLRPEVNRLRQELEAARSVPRTQSPKPPPYPDLRPEVNRLRQELETVREKLIARVNAPSSPLRKSRSMSTPPKSHGVSPAADEDQEKEKEMSRLQEEVASTRSELLRSKEELFYLKQKMDAPSKEMLDDHTSLSYEVQRLQNEVTRMKDRERSLVSKVREAEGECARLKEENIEKVTEQALRKAPSLNRTTSSMRDLELRLRNELKTVENENLHLKGQVRSLGQQMNTKDEECVQLRKEVERLEALESSRLSTIRALQEAVEGVTQSRQDVKDIVEKHLMSFMGELKSTHDQLRRQDSDGQQREEAAKKTVSLLESEISRLRADLLASPPRRSMIPSSGGKEVALLKAELTTAQNEASRLLGREKGMLQRVHDLEEEAGRSRQDAKEARKELESEVSQMTEELEERMLTIRTLQESLDRATEERNQARDVMEIQVAAFENELLEARLAMERRDRHAEEKGDLTARTVSSLEAEIASLRSALEDKQKHSVSPRSHHRMSEQHASALQMKEDLVRENADLREEVQDLKNQLDAVNSSKTFSSHALKELSKSLGQAKADRAAMKRQLIEMQEQLLATSNETEAHIEDSDSHVQALGEENRRLLDDVAQLEAKLRDAQGRCEDVENSLVNDRNRLNEYIESEMGPIRSELDLRTKERDEALLLIESLEEQLKTSEDGMDAEQTARVALEAEVKSLQETRRAHEDHIGVLQDRIRDLEHRLPKDMIDPTVWDRLERCRSTLVAARAEQRLMNVHLQRVKERFGASGLVLPEDVAQIDGSAHFGISTQRLEDVVALVEEANRMMKNSEIGDERMLENALEAGESLLSDISNQVAAAPSARAHALCDHAVSEAAAVVEAREGVTRLEDALNKAKHECSVSAVKISHLEATLKETSQKLSVVQVDADHKASVLRSTQVELDGLRDIVDESDRRAIEGSGSRVTETEILSLSTEVTGLRHKHGSALDLQMKALTEIEDLKGKLAAQKETERRLIAEIDDLKRSLNRAKLLGEEEFENLVMEDSELIEKLNATNQLLETRLEEKENQLDSTKLDLSRVINYVKEKETWEVMVASHGSAIGENLSLHEEAEIIASDSDRENSNRKFSDQDGEEMVARMKKGFRIVAYHHDFNNRLHRTKCFCRLSQNEKQLNFGDVDTGQMALRVSLSEIRDAVLGPVKPNTRNAMLREGDWLWQSFAIRTLSGTWYEFSCNSREDFIALIGTVQICAGFKHRLNRGKILLFILRGRIHHRAFMDRTPVSEVIMEALRRTSATVHGTDAIPPRRPHSPKPPASNKQEVRAQDPDPAPSPAPTKSKPRRSGVFGILKPKHH